MRQSNSMAPFPTSSAKNTSKRITKKLLKHTYWAAQQLFSLCFSLQNCTNRNSWPNRVSHRSRDWSRCQWVYLRWPSLSIVVYRQPLNSTPSSRNIWKREDFNWCISTQSTIIVFFKTLNRHEIITCRDSLSFQTGNTN